MSNKIGEVSGGRFVPLSAFMPSGIVLMYGGSSAPSGWLLCDNKTVGDSSSGADYTGDTYRDLYDAIQATWGGTYNWSNHDKINLPDMRGIFPKGAGTTDRTLGKDASGNFYAGTLGTYLTDKMQGHKHQAATQSAGAILYPGSAYAQVHNSAYTAFDTGNPKTDGTNGTPRTGHTTEPQSAGINFIIKI